jgi:hypothetical protein
MMVIAMASTQPLKFSNTAFLIFGPTPFAAIGSEMTNASYV